MAFESLTEKLQNAFKSLRGKGRLTEEDVDLALKEVRRALLEADVNFAVAKEFIAKIKAKAIGEEVFGSLNPAQTVIKIVNEELTDLLGGTQSRIMISSRPPTVIMLAGLQGAGKTTTAGKLALMLKKQGKSPMMVACDVYRPAAITQLQVLGEQVGVPVFTMENEKDPVRIATESLSYATSHLRDVVIIDTAGRLHIDEALMEELVRIKQTVRPHEILLAVDAMTGQDAVTAAKAFNEALGVDGVILTKMDGDARGGAALSIKSVTGKPIKFTGVGEKLDGLEPFYPDRMASRILDMGDIQSLIETVKGNIDAKEAQEMAESLRKGDFTLDDFLKQLQQFKKLGSMKSLLGMIPGMGKYKKELDAIDMDEKEKELRQLEAIIHSMTAEERQNAKLLNGSRRKRIALGSGTKVQDVNRLLKQYEEARKMMKAMSGLQKKGKKKFKFPF